MTEYPGQTKIFLLQNAKTAIYEHVEKEIATGDIDGINKTYSVTTAPVAVTEISTSPLSQFVDANGKLMRKDVYVLFRKDNEDTAVDTTSNPITISGTDITFTNAPTTDEADNIIVSYSHTKTSITSEIKNMDFGGGARPNTYEVVQGGERIKVESVQEHKTIALELLSVGLGFVKYVNGDYVQETIAGATSGSDILEGSVGSQSRNPGAYTMVSIATDPKTGNKRYEMFYNINGVEGTTSAPSEGSIMENCTFECQPQDYCRITRNKGQG